MHIILLLTHLVNEIGEMCSWFALVVVEMEGVNTILSIWFLWRKVFASNPFTSRFLMSENQWTYLNKYILRVWKCLWSFTIFYPLLSHRYNFHLLLLASLKSLGTHVFNAIRFISIFSDFPEMHLKHEGFNVERGKRNWRNVVRRYFHFVQNVTTLRSYHLKLHPSVIIMTTWMMHEEGKLFVEHENQITANRCGYR